MNIIFFIQQYNTNVKIINMGIILQLSERIFCIYDLDEIMTSELVEFEEDI